MSTLRTSGRTPHRSPRLLVALSAIVLTATTACASSAGSETKDGTPAEAAAAQKVVEQGTQPVDSITVKDKLSAVPAKGKTLIYMQCETASCGRFGQGMKDATKVIGWNLKVINFKVSDPGSLVTGMKAALQFKDAVAVAVPGLPEAVWSGAVPAYQAAGMKIIPFSVGDVKTSETIPVNVSSSGNFADSGALVANWFIADSKAGGNAVAVDWKEFDVVHAFANGFVDEVEKKCSSCKVTRIEMSSAQLANHSVVAAIVSAVRRDPATKYVMTPNADLTHGLQNALKGAGLSDVRVMGGGTSSEDLQNMSSGVKGAWALHPLAYIGWQVVDAAIRIDQNMQIPDSDGGLPLGLITKDNVAKDPVDSLEQPADFADQFKALWN